MSKVPDAWDDDWETLADVREDPVNHFQQGSQDTKALQKPEGQVEATPAETAPKLTKAQRRAQHQEQQKQLWNSAENPDRFHWLEAQGVVPLKQEFKPQVKLLSRKPIVPVIAKRGNADGVSNLSLEDGDSDEESRKQREADLEERQRRAKLEREEKQRKYAEARERIMGAPAASDSRNSSQGRDGRKPRAKVNGYRNSQPTSSADQSPARPSSSDKQLFDPDDMSRRLPKRETSSVPKDDGPSRQPRGPEGAGFGFAARGGKTAAS